MTIHVKNIWYLLHFSSKWKWSHDIRSLCFIVFWVSTTSEWDSIYCFSLDVLTPTFTERVGRGLDLQETTTTAQGIDNNCKRMGKWPKFRIQFGSFLQEDMKEYYNEQHPMTESHLSHCKHEKTMPQQLKQPTCPQTAWRPQFQQINSNRTVRMAHFRKPLLEGGSCGKRFSDRDRGEHTIVTTVKPDQSGGASEKKNSVMTPYFNCDDNNSVDLQSQFNFLWFPVNV